MLAERVFKEHAAIWFPSSIGPTAPPFLNEASDPFRILAAMHDRELLCHLDRVAYVCAEFARHLGMSAREQAFLAFVGFVHDIGKSFIPLRILNKRGPLTPAERAKMETHVAVGVEVVKHLPGGERISRIVSEHHERLDGRGYPRGLSSDEISVEGRLLSISDAYCAMVERRRYRTQAVDPTAELLACAGTQFDESLVRAFVKHLAEGPILRG